MTRRKYIDPWIRVDTGRPHHRASHAKKLRDDATRDRCALVRGGGRIGRVLSPSRSADSEFLVGTGPGREVRIAASHGPEYGAGSLLSQQLNCDDFRAIPYKVCFGSTSSRKAILPPFPLSPFRQGILLTGTVLIWLPGLSRDPDQPAAN